MTMFKRVDYLGEHNVVIDSNQQTVVSLLRLCKWSVTPYGLDGPGIESRWGRDFPHPSRPVLGAHPASCTIGTGSSPGEKRPGLGVDHPPLSSAEVKERVEQYVCSLSGPSWPVQGWTLPLPFLSASVSLASEVLHGTRFPNITSGWPA